MALAVRPGSKKADTRPTASLGRSFLSWEIIIAKVQVIQTTTVDEVEVKTGRVTKAGGSDPAEIPEYECAAGTCQLGGERYNHVTHWHRANSNRSFWLGQSLILVQFVADYSVVEGTTTKADRDAAAAAFDADVAVLQAHNTEVREKSRAEAFEGCDTACEERYDAAVVAYNARLKAHDDAARESKEAYKTEYAAYESDKASETGMYVDCRTKRLQSGQFGSLAARRGVKLPRLSLRVI